MAQWRCPGLRKCKVVMIHKKDPNAGRRNPCRTSHGQCTKSRNIASHAHENGLRGKLKGPESNFLETSLAGLIIHDIPSERIVCLRYS